MPVQHDHPSAVDLTLHRRLSSFNHARLTPRIPDDHGSSGVEASSDRALLERSSELSMRDAEEHFVAGERAAIAGTAAAAPGDAEGFVRWFEALRQHGPGQNDPLFPWLARTASLEQLRWFLTQEVAGEAGFEDLLALTQVKLPEQAKLEMARNFWDEMGRGHAAGMHGPMLARLAQALDVNAPAESIVPESLALGNLMIALATRRSYAYHAIGALGVIELTAPDRANHVNGGLARLGIAAHERQYFALHATLDKQHAKAWNREVLRSLARSHPHTIRAMAEGALLRLHAGARCFARYRREFDLG